MQFSRTYIAVYAPNSVLPVFGFQEPFCSTCTSRTIQGCCRNMSKPYIPFVFISRQMQCIVGIVPRQFIKEPGQGIQCCKYLVVISSRFNYAPLLKIKIPHTLPGKTYTGIFGIGRHYLLKQGFRRFVVSCNIVIFGGTGEGIRPQHF